MEHLKHYAILILLIVIAYANALQNKFVWDEGLLIVNNPKINLSLKEIPSLITKPLWKIPEFGEYPQVYYRPALSALYVLNYKIWGLNPSGFHLSNILLHLISTIILYKIGLLLFNNDKLISLIGASIFAVHPVHNESVGRAASGEVIFGFFIILSIYFFLKEKRYISWAIFFLALLSKETSVMLPFALMILSTHKNGINRGIIEMMPYAVLIGIYLIMRTMFVDVVFGEKITQPVFTRIFTMTVAALDYIRLLIIPYPLNPFYTQRWYASVFEIKVIFAIIVLASLFLFAIKIRKDRLILFLLLFPFIMLAPVIWKVNGFSIGDGETMYIAERYLYVPAMMFSLYVSASLARVFRDNTKKYLIVGWILVILTFMIITIPSNMMWKDNITIYKKITEKSPDAAFAHNNLGLAYYEQGLTDEAIKEYITALTINPNSKLTHNNLGVAYYEQGRLADAIQEYLTALKLDPDNANTHNNLGNAYASQSYLDKAINEYLTALKLNPAHANAYYNLGNAYYKKGMFDDAVNEYKKALELEPNRSDAYNNIGYIYYEQGRIDDAVDEYLKAIRLSPDNAEAHYNLGLAYIKKGLNDMAKKGFEIALKLKPDFIEAQKAIEELKSSRESKVVE